MSQMKSNPDTVRSRRRKYWCVALLVCLACAAWVLYAFWTKDANTEHEHAIRTGQGRIHSICLTPEGDKLLVGGHDGTIQIRSFPEGEFLANFKAHDEGVTPDEGVTHIAVSSDGSTIYSTGAWRLNPWDSEPEWHIRAWDLKTQKLVAELPLDGPASAVTAHPHRRLVAVQSFVKGFTVRLWDLDNGGKATVVDRVLVSHGITFSADGRLLAFDDSVSEGNWVCVWEVDPVKQRTRLRTDIHCDVGLEFLGDTHTLAVGGGKYLSEHVIEIWDIEGRLLRTLSKQEDDIILQKFVATRDGLTIVGGLVYTVRVWDVSTGKAIKEFAAQGEGIVDMAMTKNGEWLAIAHGDIAEDYSGGHAKITIWRLK